MASRRYKLLYAATTGLLVALVLSCRPLAAQATLGAATLSGIVLDAQGAAVAGAEVVLFESSKNLNHRQHSDGLGRFLFPNLAAGLYELTVEKEGFNVTHVPELRIDVGQRTAVDITMQIGDLRASITVSAGETALLNTESNVIGPVVDSERVRQLPLNGRNFLQLSQLAATVVDVTAANDSFSANLGQPGRLIVPPGALPNSVGYTLNGTEVRGSRDGELSANVSIAAIDQFRVQQGFFLPDQGAQSAVVNVATKSGGNKFHGEAFEFLRNTSLDARSFFASAPEELKRNQFGFALGGPLRKDRFWFHGFYEGLRETKAFSSAGYSPTAAMFDGDLTETGRTVYDPASFSGATGARQAFPGNLIPATRINPVATGLSQYYLPGNKLSNRPSNVFGNPRNTLNDDQFGLRLDGSWNSSQSLFLQLLQQDNPATTRGLYPMSGAMYPNETGLATLQHIWSINPNTVNTLRASFVRSVALGGNEARSHGQILDTIGVENTLDGRGVTQVNLLGYSSFGRSNGDVGNADNTWQFDWELLRTRSSHAFKFGAGLRYRRGWHQNSNAFANGSLSFEPAFSAQLVSAGGEQLTPAPGTGDSWADFLLGAPSSGRVLGLGVVEYRNSRVSLFFQDSWRVSRSLTLNYGVSWFLSTVPDPRGSLRETVHGFDRASGLIQFASLGQISPQAVAADHNNLAPRFGFAWRPKALPNTVIRGGVGLYYSEFPWIGYQFSLIGPPYAPTQVFANPPTNPFPRFELGRNVFSPTSSVAPGLDYAENVPQGTATSGIDPALATPYVSQWNLSIQRAFGVNDLVELAYIGASGHRLANLSEMAQCRPVSGLYCDPATKPWDARYGAIYWADTSGNSSYNSLLARYEHRYSGGLSLGFEYAFAKSLADAWQSSRDPYGQITSCRRCDRGPASFDVRHRAVASAVWELPVGRSRRYGGTLSRAANMLIGGWSVTAIVSAATGPPVYLKAPNRTGSALILHLPNRVCDGRDDRLSGNIEENGFRWFNASCFPVPEAGYFGNSGRTVIPGPGLSNWDIGVSKTITANEQLKIEFRAELFNAWNHTQFQTPNGDAGADALFGLISSTRPPRLIQLGIKMLW